jgi:hypothetical protein
MTQIEVVKSRRRREAHQATRAGASRPLRTLDGVIMLDPFGRPPAGPFPDNVWVVMGTAEDCIEDFFGPCDDVLTADIGEFESEEDACYCVGFEGEDQDIVLNGGGSYPVYVSGLLRANRGGLD